MHGSLHIQSVLTGVEYQNFRRTVDVYSFFFQLIVLIQGDHQNWTKTILFFK